MDINKTLREMAQYKILIEEAEAEYNRLREMCEEHMTEEGTDTIIGDEHKVTWKEVTSNRFDSTAFRKDHGDMYKAYQKASTSKRFTFA